ncbi:MAG: hypothetical protein CVU56_18415 [Deltaproteobacteria bacterium HGW-Deltaproteobacteria-14]|nr:MAG: hypothetical protein CVU56_18415 [Deltaproteobacteria bacterium HGW-Deltaproteobacteria-14]
MNKISMAALASVATMLVGAGSALAGEGADAAPRYEPECQDASECAEGEACLWGSCYTPEACAVSADCWTGWCGSDGFCSEAPGCETDAECGEGNICDWGQCAPRGRSCLSDSECGDFAHCVFDDYTTVDVGTASASSTDPAPSSGGGSASGSGSGSSSSESDGAPIPDPDYDVPAYVEHGECRVDVEALPEVADCRAMCEAAAACASTGVGAEPTPAPAYPTDPSEPQRGGASDSDGGDAEAQPACDPDPSGPDGAEAGCMEPYPNDDDDVDTSVPSEQMIALFVEQCTLICSYGVATEPTNASAVAAAVSCLSDEPSCDAMETACGAEIEAIEVMFEAVGERVDLGDGFASDNSTSTAGTDPPRGNEDAGAQSLGATPVDNSACNGSGGGAPLSLALAMAALLLVTRRRGASQR